MMWRRIAGWRTRRREDAALIEELEFHRAQVQADFESQGVPATEARLASRRVMGNVTLAREDAREVRIWRWVDQLQLDVRCSVRSLLHHPLVAIAALLATALGVATTTTVFSVADAELWKPLPFSEPEQLVAIVSRGPGDHSPSEGVSGADLRDWRGVQAFTEIAMRGRSSRQVLQFNTAESVVVSEVTANYFTTLGVRAVAGRVFEAGDATTDRRIIVTERAWKRLFSNDPAVVGRSVRLDETDAVIIGVTPVDNSLGPDPDFFLTFDEQATSFLDRSNLLGYGATARLRSGVDAQSARAALQTVADASSPSDRRGRRIEVKNLAEYHQGNNWRPLYFFLGAAIAVLLLGMINVATLLLSRAIQRAPEFALRRALGGGQSALARQLFVEGLLLASAGGGLGILFASWAVNALMPLMPAGMLLRGADIPIDFRVAAFSLAATGVATVVFGLVPLPLARTAGASDALRSGARAGRGVGEGRARSILLAVQIALTLVLLAGAGMFLKSFNALTRVPLGFIPANLAALRVSLSGPRYADDESLRAYGHRLVEMGTTFPGARTATISTSAPLGSGPLVYFARTGEPRPAPGEEARAILRSVSADYFRTMAIQLVRGREFATGDVPGTPRVAIVNAVLAKRLFGDENPIGQLIDLLPSRAPWTNRPGALTIVGVAANIKEVGINEIEFGDVYVPFDQMPSNSLELIVRTASQPDVNAIRTGAADLDPFVPVTSATTFNERVDDALAGDAFNLAIVSSFAAVAILLSGIGIYAAAAYHVQSRTREFGVRLALGGAPRTLVLAAVWRTARPALIGGTAGIGVVLILSRLIGNALYLVPGSHNGLLFGVTTTDPPALIAAFVGLLLVALIAAALPARQLTRIDPMLTLSAD